MDGYSLLQPALFSLEPEKAHALAMKLLGWSHRLGLTSAFCSTVTNPISLLGMRLQNSVGLAAGFDKNAEYLTQLATLGFGFIEVGTVTPEPQPGNPRPRLFRLPAERAIINRMGFNNLGVDVLVRNVRASKYTGVLGVNIGANRTTAEENRINDYLTCLEKVHEIASYVVVNVSSPNTPGLRNLQQRELFEPLLSALKRRSLQLRKDLPLLLKISPDLNDSEILDIATLCTELSIDGIVATNTTVSRDGVVGASHETEQGGLSGAPLKPKALNVVRSLRAELPDSVPIVACGGIMAAADALEFKVAGAACVQIYTGFIYRGPGLITTIARQWQ